MNGGLPRYVERGGEVVYCPPGVATGVRMYAFILQADSVELQRLMQRYLNQPSNGFVNYVPAGSLVVCNFTTLQHVGALTPPDVGRGFFLESEAAIWCLGYDTNKQVYDTFVPYMIVDQGAAMAMGREVYGFPKQLGIVDMPDPAAKPDKFSVTVQGVKQWGQDQQFTALKLLEATQTDPNAPAPTHDFASQAELVGAMVELLADDRGVVSPLLRGAVHDDIDHSVAVASLLMSATMPMVFLKQIRDGTEPTKACYQAIQRANFVVTGFRGAGRLPGQYRIDIEDLANEPIRREFGFSKGPLTPVAAFWVDFDFTLSVAEPLWASVGRTAVKAREPDRL